jgi:hypothetical protein
MYKKLIFCYFDSCYTAEWEWISSKSVANKNKFNRSGNDLKEVLMRDLNK